MGDRKRIVKIGCRCAQVNPWDIEGSVVQSDDCECIIVHDIDDVSQHDKVFVEFLEIEKD